MGFFHVLHEKYIEKQEVMAVQIIQNWKKKQNV